MKAAIMGAFSYVEHQDKSIKISYEDSLVGGGSYEAIYDIDPVNREKLERLLSRHAGSLKQKITSEFGKCFEKKSFAEYCDQNGVKYELFTWIEDD